MSFDFNGPNKERARISRNIVDAYTNSEQRIEKSKAISQTRSGKLIYDVELEKQDNLYSDYNAEDHQDIIDYYETTKNDANIAGKERMKDEDLNDIISYHKNEIAKKKENY